MCQPLPDALTHRPPLAPLPGYGSSRITHPVVSLRSTTGYKLVSLRDEDITWKVWDLVPVVDW